MPYILFFITTIFSINAFAGGIAFKDKYVGKHPFTGSIVTLEFKKTTISLNVADSLGHAEDLVITPVSRNRFERIFKLQQGNDDGRVAENAPILAKLITTGDCQVLQKAALVFPSGVSVPLSVSE